MPPIYADEDIPTRLARLVEDMGYVRGGRRDMRRATAVIRSRAGVTDRQWPDRRLEMILGGTRSPTIEDLKTISLGLGIDLRVIAWGFAPPLPRRKATSMFDEAGPAS